MVQPSHQLLESFAGRHYNGTASPREVETHVPGAPAASDNPRSIVGRKTEGLVGVVLVETEQRTPNSGCCTVGRVVPLERHLVVVPQKGWLDASPLPTTCCGSC